MSAMIELIHDANRLEGTAYFELLPGMYRNKCWNRGSVFLNEENFGYIEPMVESCVEKYDHYSFVEVNRDKCEKILAQLLSLKRAVHESDSIDDLDGKIGFFFADTRERFAKEFDKNKRDLEKMLSGLAGWIRQTIKEHERMSILGL